MASQPVVTVFSTPGCPYCKRAKEALTKQGFSYTDVDVATNQQLRTTLRDVTGERTVPQIFVNGTCVGGSDALLAAIDDGSIARLAAAAPAAPAADHAALLPAELAAAVKVAASEAEADHGSAGAASPLEVPQPLQALVQRLAPDSTGVPRSTAKPSSCRQPQPAVFSGRALLDWLLADSAAAEQLGAAPDRGAALQLAQRLLAANVVCVVSDTPPKEQELAVADSDDPLLRLRSDAARAVAFGAPLNTPFWWGPAPPRPAPLVAEELRARILTLYDRHLSADGRAVAYTAIRDDPDFWAFVDATAELQRVDLSGLSRPQLMAFAINLYNALVVHALVVHGTHHLTGTVSRLNFFAKAARYLIGGSEYVADDIENGILRGNSPSAASLGMLLRVPWLSSGPFGRGDPRAKAVVTPVDARIHFALVCGAKSCPPIKLYSADNLEEGLAAAAEAFCGSEVAVDAASKQVTLSKIFKWYYPDFGSNQAERLRYVLPCLQGEAADSLKALLDADPQARGIKVVYSEYDWTTNAAEE